MSYNVCPNTPQGCLHPDGIYTSAPAYLVYTMTSPWHSEDSGAGAVLHLEAEDMKKANDNLPWAMDVYLNRAFINALKQGWMPPSHVFASWGKPITREMFDEAREFIRKCAVNNWDITGA
jgi:hypothetical protein